jgi:hypothetical protein
LAAVAAVAGALAAGCTGGGGRPGPTAPPALTVGWRELAAPAADAPVGIGDVTWCAGRWYAAGSLRPPGQRTRPALWSSPDGATWRPHPTLPVSPYGEYHVLYSVACAGDRLVAVGAASGGAHGNPRTGTWVAALPDGPLREVAAGFEQYGGPDAVSVDRVAAGPGGFLVAGNRLGRGTGLAGAAVWSSPDGAEFTLIDGDPALASRPALQGAAADAVAGPAGWVLVGGVRRGGSAGRDPAAWSSPDGRQWRRDEPPGSPGEDEALERAARLGDAVVALGPQGGGFAAWRYTGTAWSEPIGFGRHGGAQPPRVTGVTTTPDGLVAAVADGTTHRLWTSPDATVWRELRTPSDLPAGPTRRLLVAAAGSRLMVVADDGERARIFVADEKPA